MAAPTDPPLWILETVWCNVCYKLGDVIPAWNNSGIWESAVIKQIPCSENMENMADLDTPRQTKGTALDLTQIDLYVCNISFAFNR